MNTQRIEYLADLPPPDILHKAREMLEKSHCLLIRSRAGPYWIAIDCPPRPYDQLITSLPGLPRYAGVIREGLRLRYTPLCIEWLDRHERQIQTRFDICFAKLI